MMTEHYTSTDNNKNIMKYADIDFQPLIDIERNVEQQDNNSTNFNNEITKAIKNEANKRRCWKTTTVMILITFLLIGFLTTVCHSSDNEEEEEEVVKCGPDNLYSLLGIKSIIATECFEEQYPDFEVVTNMPGIRPFDDDQKDRIQLYINPDATIHTITAPGIHEGIIH